MNISVYRALYEYLIDEETIPQSYEGYKGKVPPVLLSLYETFSDDSTLYSSFNKILPLEECYIDEGFWFFCIENQDVLRWCVKISDLEKSDPPVYQYNPASGEVYLESKSSSTFLGFLIGWQILNALKFVTEVSLSKDRLGEILPNYRCLNDEKDKSYFQKVYWDRNLILISFPEDGFLYVGANEAQDIYDFEDTVGVMMNWS